MDALEYFRYLSRQAVLPCPLSPFLSFPFQSFFFLLLLFLCSLSLLSVLVVITIEGTK